jgi:glycosyltransferase involved in cell wall biosynthesis
MRICHVITRLIIGGAQENTVATCIGLQKLGHEVELVTGSETGPEGSLHEQARTAGVPVIVVDELRRAPNPFYDLIAVRALARLFRDRRCEIVHTHSGKAGFLGRLAAKWASVPVVVHTIHGPSFYEYQNPIGNWLFKSAEQLAAEWTTQFVSVADAMTEQYLAAGIGQPHQYVTIRSGINIEAFVAASSARWGTGRGEDAAPTIGKVARLFRLKGHKYLFAAAPRIVAAVPNVKFLLVGDGTYRKKFERQVERIGMRDRFEFAGLVPPEQIPATIARMDVLVHLSLREGLPRTLTQGLACGKPVVAFNVDGAREVCIDGQTGFLIGVGDVTALADAVIRLLQDKTLADRLGEQGRSLAREEFSQERMVQRIDELYQRLMKA